MKFQKMNFSKHIAAILSALLLSACASHPISSKISMQEKPINNRVVDINVIYITDSISTSNLAECKNSSGTSIGLPACESSATSGLSYIGFYDFGKHFQKIIKTKFSYRGINCDTNLMTSSEYKVSQNSLAASKSNNVLTLYFSKVSISKYSTSTWGGMDLNVAYSDKFTKKLYWNAEYHIIVNKGSFFDPINIFVNQPLDEKYINRILNTIFSDMEKSGLLPLEKT
jgi:hypothetical protein